MEDVGKTTSALNMNPYGFSSQLTVSSPPYPDAAFSILCIPKPWFLRSFLDVRILPSLISGATAQGFVTEIIKKLSVFLN